MKGNEATAHAAIRCGCDGYFGYPITPQTEVIETLMELEPWKTTGMAVLQAESEVAAINMIYGAAASGKKVMTSSSSPGISLMSEAISYIAACELPCLIVNVQRTGPGLGTIQPMQSDYFQACKGGGHGDYHLIVLAPDSVQEMHDFVSEGFDLAFKYRNPVMILSDGLIGQMMEKVTLAPMKPRRTDEEVVEECGDWALTGKAGRKRNIVNSHIPDIREQERITRAIYEKYDLIARQETRYEEFMTEDAEYLIVAFGSSARICKKVVELARAEGIKVGLLRPITLYPFPTQIIRTLAGRVKGIISVELSTGQMVEDVRLAVEGTVPVEFYGCVGGVVYSPGEILAALKTKLKIEEK